MTRTIIAVSIFSTAMAALESAVVVYLRALYYPTGFSVAFKLIDEKILLIEILREAATLAMLISIGYLAGRDLKSRIAYFLLSFAVWDICYYVWLKLFIDWPASLLDWDILFLIPFTWLGPVLAPVVCSLTMIVLATAMLANDRPVSVRVWLLLLTGSVFIMYTFMEDYGSLLISNGFLTEYSTILENEDFLRLASAYMPTRFNWLVFWFGELLFLTAIYLHTRRLLPGEETVTAGAP